MSQVLFSKSRHFLYILLLGTVQLERFWLYPKLWLNSFSLWSRDRFFILSVQILVIWPSWEQIIKGGCPLISAQIWWKTNGIWFLYPSVLVNKIFKLTRQIYRSQLLLICVSVCRFVSLSVTLLAIRFQPSKSNGVFLSAFRIPVMFLHFPSYT